MLQCLLALAATRDSSAGPERALRWAPSGREGHHGRGRAEHPEQRAVAQPAVGEHGEEGPAEAAHVGLHPLQHHDAALRVLQPVEPRGADRRRHGQDDHQHRELADPRQQHREVPVLADEAPRRGAHDRQGQGAQGARGQLRGVRAVRRPLAQGAGAAEARDEGLEGHGQEAEGCDREGLAEVARPLCVAHGQRHHRQDSRLHEHPRRAGQPDGRAAPVGLLAGLLAGTAAGRSGHGQHAGPGRHGPAGEAGAVAERGQPPGEGQQHPGQVREADEGQHDGGQQLRGAGAELPGAGQGRGGRGEQRPQAQAEVAHEEAQGLQGHVLVAGAHGGQHEAHLEKDAGAQALYEPCQQQQEVRLPAQQLREHDANVAQQQEAPEEAEAREVVGPAGHRARQPQGQRHGEVHAPDEQAHEHHLRGQGRGRRGVDVAEGGGQHGRGVCGEEAAGSQADELHARGRHDGLAVVQHAAELRGGLVRVLGPRGVARRGRGGRCCVAVGLALAGGGEAALRGAPAPEAGELAAADASGGAAGLRELRRRLVALHVEELLELRRRPGDL
mmetsp:Transcript_6314/g.19505  ORF Transcript_6314/g.19505 Transcript_6314/m.19505 type:complete len:558 (-) Transcript_6314:963-2636(-)